MIVAFNTNTMVNVETEVLSNRQERVEHDLGQGSGGPTARLGDVSSHG